MVVRAIFAVLMLIAVFFGFIWNPAWIALPPAAPESRITEDQAQFCEALGSSRAEYYKLLKDWSAAHKEKNGIVTARISKQMDVLVRERNARIFKLLQDKSFALDDWEVVLLEIETPINNQLDLKVRPTCSKTILFRIRADASSIPFFLDKKKDSRVLVSGRFVEGHSTRQPTSAEKFEMSFTDSGSMEEPEYAIVATAFSR